MPIDPLPHSSPSATRRKLTGLLLAGALVVGACSTGGTNGDDTTAAAADAASSDTSGGEVVTVAASMADETSGVFDASVVHDIAVEFDADEYEAAIAAYLATGDKEWIEASVTIDGVTYDQVGLRLKGNSSLRTVDADSDPETLPWLIRFDKYVDGQTHEGYADLVVRSNTTTTALNEAVALDLLEAAGLASQQAVSTSFSVNGSEGVLRLVVEHPDDVWMDDTFGSDGALYKAESTGDYSYRGDDPDAYDDVFDQEAGEDNADLTPLIEFLDFINNAEDATFEAELVDHLDVEAFADYLAMMDLVDNFDDIDGPGNNSYLSYDTDTEAFTVVAWDLNLAFGVRNADEGGPPELGNNGRARPEPPAGVEGASRPDAGGPNAGGIGGPAGSNVLAERFHATASFEALYQDALARLRADLFDSGVASDILAARVGTLTDAGELVDSATLATESAAIATVAS